MGKVLNKCEIETSSTIYDVLVVGAGHAGIEAALAPARLGLKTLMVCGSFDRIGNMPCNPSIGGPAKGILVREIDALGGQMAKTSDKTCLQVKMLNMSKGPAVRAMRVQSDKIAYAKYMQSVVVEQENLDIYIELVDSLIIEDNKIKGVVFESGLKAYSKCVIITTGTYLSSNILCGKNVTPAGPDGEATNYGLSKSLKESGFKLIRLKTGTPPRIYTNTIDLFRSMDIPVRKFPCLNISAHSLSISVPLVWIVLFMTLPSAYFFSNARTCLKKSFPSTKGSPPCQLNVTSGVSHVLMYALMTASSISQLILGSLPL